MGLGSIWEISVPSTQFHCEFKILFKKSIFEKVPEPYMERFLFYLHIYAF